MIWLLANWRSTSIVVLIVGICYFSFSEGRDYTQRQWDKAKATLVKQVVDNAQVVHDLGVSHDKDQTTIDKLAADNHALWLRLPKTPCVGVSPSSTSEQTPTGVEPLPTDPQQTINGYTEGVGSLMHEADTVVNDCRVVIEWVKTLEKK